MSGGIRGVYVDVRVCACAVWRREVCVHGLGLQEDCVQMCVCGVEEGCTWTTGGVGGQGPPLVKRTELWAQRALAQVLPGTLMSQASGRSLNHREASTC